MVVRINIDGSVILCTSFSQDLYGLFICSFNIIDYFLNIINRHFSCLDVHASHLSIRRKFVCN